MELAENVKKKGNTLKVMITHHQNGWNHGGLLFPKLTNQQKEAVETSRKCSRGSENQWVIG